MLACLVWIIGIRRHLRVEKFAHKRQIHGDFGRLARCAVHSSVELLLLRR